MNQDFDVLLLSAEEFAQLEDWQLQTALQQLTGYMAVANAKMRVNAQAHADYLASKEQFTSLRTMATTIQTQLRVRAQLS